MKKITLCFCVFFMALRAHAEMSKSTIVSLNTIYIDREYQNNGTTTQDKMTDTDFRLMRVEKNWAYGLIYALSSSDSSDANRTSYSVSLGYYSEKDFYLNFHYFLSSQYDLGSSTRYSKGNGYEIDLGFLSKVTSSFYCGLMFAIKNFKYNEQNVNGVTSDASATHKEVLPMFTFAVRFM